MQKWSCLAVSMLALTLAGCTEPADVVDGDGVGLETQVVRLDWGYSGCDAVIGIFPVSAAAFEGLLPEGFMVQPFREVIGAPLPVDPDGADGNFGVELLVCDEGIGLDGASSDAGVYGSYFAGVVPPEGLRRDVDLHFVKWDVGIADAGLRDLLVARGVPAVPVSGAYAVAQGMEPVMANIAGEMQMGDVSHFIDGASTLPNSDYPTGRFVEYTQTNEGLVEWQATFTWASSGLGIVDLVVNEGSLAADVLGSDTPVVGAGFIGVVDFHDGWIQLPGDGL